MHVKCTRQKFNLFYELINMLTLITVTLSCVFVCALVLFYFFVEYDNGSYDDHDDEHNKNKKRYINKLWRACFILYKIPKNLTF